jgi:HD-GYP domain-containing protein (c-di-GMP phosphodiesterase class II)
MKAEGHNPQTPYAANADHRIEHAKHQLEQMIDLAPQIMLLVESGGKVVRANKAALSFLNLDSFNEILGRRITDILQFSHQELLSSLGSEEPGYKVFETEFGVGEKNGTARFRVVGSVTGQCVVILEDITEDKIRQADEEKKHKLDAIKALTGALMHRINQDLTVINVRTQLMSVALDKENVDQDELRTGLRDISSLSLKIASLLRCAGNQTDFVTRPYLAQTDILDIQPNSQGRDPLAAPQMKPFRILTSLMNVHDPTYSNHAFVTAACSGRLAEELDLPEQEIAACQRAGFLHDIGKIGVPAGILRKPDRLDLNEDSVMRKHVENGFELLDAFPLTRIEAETALRHHERYDGKGYPSGLAGKDIPLITRIVSVADAFEAMRSTRSYDQARSFEKVFNAILEGSGKQFAPEVTEAFKSCAQDLDAFIHS